MLEIITIGSAIEDIIFKTRQGKIIHTPKDPTAKNHLAFEFGAKINIKHVTFGIGGGACNAATSLALLGINSGICARLGTDKTGKRIREHLLELGVDVSLIQYDDKEQTGLSTLIIKEPEREHVIFPYRGANMNLAFPKENIEKFRPKWLYLSSLRGKHWKEVMSQVMLYCQRNHIKLAINPGSAQLLLSKKELERYFTYASVLLLNKDEAIELLSSSIAKKDLLKISMDEILVKLARYGADLSVVSDGSKGAYVYDGKIKYFAKALKVKTIDTTGAGDAFGSTFIGGMILTKEDIKTSLQYAIVNSAYVTTQTGAQNGLLSLKEIKKRISDIIVKVQPL